MRENDVLISDMKIASLLKNYRDRQQYNTVYNQQNEVPGT